MILRMVERICATQQARLRTARFNLVSTWCGLVLLSRIMPENRLISPPQRKAEIHFANLAHWLYPTTRSTMNRVQGWWRGLSHPTAGDWLRLRSEQQCLAVRLARQEQLA